MNKQEIIDRLFALNRFGIKPGLERVTAILNSVGNPHSKYPSIHVAGTNGKGSVCSALASIMMESGKKTALYTSPHLVDFNERMMINGTQISDEDIIRLAEQFLPFSESIQATFFEITTAIAFQWFAENQVDIAIIETGMGGRYDATNVIKPLLAIITSIHLDHKQYLGDDIPSIAYEKAGIIKKNTPVIISENSQNIYDVVAGVAREQAADMYKTNDSVLISELEYQSDFSMSFTAKLHNDEYNIESHLLGQHQVQNLSSVILSLYHLPIKYKPTQIEILAGIKNIKSNIGIKSRVECIDNTKPIIFDVAHNPAAIKVLAESLQNCRSDIAKWNVLFGAMDDKDIASMLAELRPICKELVITQIEFSRAASCNKIRNIALKSDFKSITVIENTKDAYNYFYKLNDAFIVVGSFYLLGEIMEKLKIDH